jgi:hypothetical protein
MGKIGIGKHLLAILRLKQYKTLVYRSKIQLCANHGIYIRIIFSKSNIIISFARIGP